MKIKGRSNYKPGPKDECGSPPYSIVPLFSQLERYRVGLGIPRTEFLIWEPATGLMHDREPHVGLVEGLKAVGYQVFAPRFEDFIEADFNKMNTRCVKEIGLKIRAILTNPPFSVALKRRFISQCNDIFKHSNIPYALLMNTTTLVEKVNGQTLRGCSVHIPFGRICFNMPNKGWGDKECQTKATFSTNWFTKGFSAPYSIHYDSFDMSDHFAALECFYNDFINSWHLLG